MIRAFRLHLKRFIILLSSCISKFCIFFVANFFSRITVTEVSILSYLHLKNLVDRVIVMTDWSKLTWDQRIATCNSKTHEQEPTYNKRKKMRMEKKAKVVITFVTQVVVTAFHKWFIRRDFALFSCGAPFVKFLVVASVGIFEFDTAVPWQRTGHFCLLPGTVSKWYVACAMVTGDIWMKKKNLELHHFLLQDVGRHFAK